MHFWQYCLWLGCHANACIISNTAWSFGEDRSSERASWLLVKVFSIVCDPIESGMTLLLIRIWLPTRFKSDIPQASFREHLSWNKVWCLTNDELDYPSGILKWAGDIRLASKCFEPWTFLNCGIYLSKIDHYLKIPIQLTWSLETAWPRSAGRMRSPCSNNRPWWSQSIGHLIEDSVSYMQE